VLACLAKRAEDRPKSAREVARTLAAIEVEPWTDAQAMEWWRLEGRAVARRRLPACQGLDQRRREGHLQSPAVPFETR